MENYLDEAIRILEELKTKQARPDRRIFEQLGELYQLRLEIVELHIERATEGYEAAVAALEDVIAEGNNAMEDTGKIASTLLKVDKAVTALRKVIDAVN